MTEAEAVVPAAAVANSEGAVLYILLLIGQSVTLLLVVQW